MKTRIKSDQLVRYLSMGCQISQLGYNDTACWLVMEGPLRQKILDDLNLAEDDIDGHFKIPKTKVTYRMLCCWYAMERYGLTATEAATVFGIDRSTAVNAHEKVDEHLVLHGEERIDLWKDGR